MPARKKATPKKAARSRKIEITELDSAKDPKGGLNFEEVKSAVQPPAGADDPLKWSWGMCDPGTFLNKK